MITTKEKIVNQLMGTIYLDKDDKSVYHVNMDNVLHILINNDFIIPKKTYELNLERLLNSKLTGSAAVGHTTKYYMALAMYELALQMAVSKDDIIKYELMNKEDIINRPD